MKTAKSCNLVDGQCEDCGGTGGECKAEISLADLLRMERGELPPRAVRLTAVQARALSPPIEELDPTLLGNRIEALTKAIGIPPCGGCASRRDWLNRAHAWLRG